MPREIVLANSCLFVNLDDRGWIRDLYYPHAGELNHVLGYPCRVGLSVDGRFVWLDEACHPRVSYRSGASVVARVTWELSAEDLKVEMLAAIHPDSPYLIRRFHVTNHGRADQTVGLFLHHDLRIAESDIGDTALFHPGLRAMVHHKRDFWFGIGTFHLSPPIVQYACGIKGFGDCEGTWRDAEDGWLSLNAIAQGSVDSTIMLQAEVGAGSNAALDVWLACARGLEELESLARTAVAADPGGLLDQADAAFQRELDRSDLHAKRSSHQDAFARALHVAFSHCADTGGIVAANDTDILQTARAHYSYVWPRDGAIISVALARAGYPEHGWRFIDFCRPLISTHRPYFLQKYGPTGTIGASWHPWVEHGREIVPFQEDGTALVLWLAGELFAHHRDAAPHAGGRPDMRLYREFIRPMADFISAYVDPDTDLPLPSYGPWEERRGVHAWTCGAIVAGLRAASSIAGVLGLPEDERIYSGRAATIGEAVRRHLWDDSLGRYARSAWVRDAHSVHRDPAPDASISGLFLFGAFSAQDERLAGTMEQVFDALRVKTPVGGIARYKGDYYFRVIDDLELVPGNPWIICTLWEARWAAARGDTVRAQRLLDWALAHSSPTGLLPEQLHPLSGRPLAVQPLAWAHAEVLLTLMESGLCAAGADARQQAMGSTR